MNLTLEIISTNGQGLGPARRKVFGPEGGRIGRSADCEWVIPNPYISRHHATVRWISGTYYIESTGENGVAINARQAMIPQRERRALSNGDRLFLDEYEMTVSIEATSAATAAGTRPLSFAPVDDPLANLVATARSAPLAPDPLEPSPEELDPLKQLGGGTRSTLPVAPAEVNWNHTPGVRDQFTPPRVPGGGGIPDNWDQTSFARGNPPLPPARTAAPPITRPPTPNAPPPGSEAIPTNWDQTSLGRPSAPPSRQPVPPTQSIPRAPLAPAGPAIPRTQAIPPAQGFPPEQGIPPSQGYPSGQGISPVQGFPSEQGIPPTQRFPPGQGIPPTQGYPPGQGIPPAQGYPPGRGIPPAQGFPPTQEIPPTQRIPPAQAMPPMQAVPLSQPIPSTQVIPPLHPTLTPPVPPSQGAPIPQPPASRMSSSRAAPPSQVPPATPAMPDPSGQRARGAPLPLRPAPVTGGAGQPDAATSGYAPAPGYTPAPTVAYATGQGPAAVGAVGSFELEALFRAAGIDPSTVPPETAASLGLILRTVVQGVVEVLQARAEIKHEFRLPLTRIRTTENNPLKFSVNAEDAMNALLGRRSPAYLGAVEAFEDAFDDIRFHQMAMLAGMRAGFEHVLKRFEPQRLQEIFDKRLKGGGLLMSTKSRYWELYGEEFRALTEDADDAFKRLFGEVFGEAYERQLEELKRSRQKPR